MAIETTRLTPVYLGLVSVLGIPFITSLPLVFFNPEQVSQDTWFGNRAHGAISHYHHHHYHHHHHHHHLSLPRFLSLSLSL